MDPTTLPVDGKYFTPMSYLTWAPEIRNPAGSAHPSSCHDQDVFGFENPFSDVRHALVAAFGAEVEVLLIHPLRKTFKQCTKKFRGGDMVKSAPVHTEAAHLKRGLTLFSGWIPVETKLKVPDKDSITATATQAKRIPAHPNCRILSAVSSNLII